MSVTYTTVYRKNGAVFATAQEAQADKNRLFSPVLLRSMDDCFNQMWADGVLVEPIYSVWDQDTFTLSIVVVVRSEAEYLATNFGFTFSDVAAEASKTGWTFVRKFLSQ